MCLEGFNPSFLRKSFTNSSFASVSCVVPDFETRTKRLFDGSTDAITALASSGSTLEINFAFIFILLFFTAHSSSARYIARGPRSEPPIPICTTVVNFSPFAFATEPECTLSAKEAIASFWDL